MQIVKYIIPDTGEVVEVPQADAEHFDAKGWQRAEDQQEEVPQADAGPTPEGAGATNEQIRNNKRNNRR